MPVTLIFEGEIEEDGADGLRWYAKRLSNLLTSDGHFFHHSDLRSWQLGDANDWTLWREGDKRIALGHRYRAHGVAMSLGIVIPALIPTLKFIELHP